VLLEKYISYMWKNMCECIKIYKGVFEDEVRKKYKLLRRFLDGKAKTKRLS
jgi:hypothetical protein